MVQHSLRDASVGFAVDPTNVSRYYVAVASGGVWKTVNAGITWTPVFDNEGSYSIGAIVLDPKNPLTVWVGTGENNSQRSVSYGNGVYKSEDGGRTWRNVGLKTSEHIGRIAIDPKDSNIVYVASQGPLWGPGGERGLFKTTDGGKTWKNILNISENTGVTDVVIDPNDPNTIYCASYQRRRHMWTLINGGPESAIYKSTDAGATWNKLRAGLPTVEMGRIGLAISPVDSNVIYATVEAADRKGGIFRSGDRGGSWERRNEFDATAMYYARIVADPKDVDRIYVMNVFLMVSDDGGRTLRRLGEKNKHVDNHDIWIDPANTDHYLVGCDGGIYESYDRGAELGLQTEPSGAAVLRHHHRQREAFLQHLRRHAGQLQFWWSIAHTQRFGHRQLRLVCHKRRRRFSFASRSGRSEHGLCVATARRDRPFRQAHGRAHRHSTAARSRRRSAALELGHAVHHQPASRTRDSISLPTSSIAATIAATRGQVISGQLSRALDRDKLPVMGRIWGIDAVAKNASTAFFGNASALAESQKKDGLIYVGTDDGLLQITEDGGKNWRKIDKFPGVADMSYVSRIITSNHDANTAYVAFDNHQNADFKPYLLKTTDAGRTWTSLSANLPKNGPVWAIAEDHVNPNLLFTGTEFGLYFSVDGGQKWIQLKGGMPTIAVRDLNIQKRENDLVVGDVRSRHLHSRQLHAAAFDQAGNAATGSGRVSGEGRVDVHPVAATRRPRQEFSGRAFLHRRQSAVRRDRYVVFERSASRRKKRNGRRASAKPRRKARRSVGPRAPNCALKKRKKRPRSSSRSLMRPTTSCDD